MLYLDMVFIYILRILCGTWHLVLIGIMNNNIYLVMKFNNNIIFLPVNRVQDLFCRHKKKI